MTSVRGFRTYIGLTGVDEVSLHPHLPTFHLHHKASSIGEVS
ncbi:MULTISPECIES: hypothetical protein [unclassified Bradyrhizobium]|nr:MULTISPECIES: hypothetical protein [unclassified Bradyrhizobium]